jgi:hypothetical protein
LIKRFKVKMGCTCIGDNPNEACGYPPQTVRAIISIFAVTISFTLFTFMAIWLSINEKYTEAMGIVGIISTELGTIVGYYFGTRNRTEQKQDLENMERAAVRIARRIEIGDEGLNEVVMTDSHTA